METFNRTFRHFMKTITPVSATTFFFFEAIGPPPFRPTWVRYIFFVIIDPIFYAKARPCTVRHPLFLSTLLFFFFRLFFFALFNTSPVNSSFLTPYCTYVLLPLFVLFVFFLSVLYS
ncbi:hypothetical protein K457DRAFT_632775 [Linnemannia elongata AG-77]|uniref:Uncharacterized protein n=1 Tax=Linnemannia elongata AG-77 TaxID=1314771 RepID=A0A197JSD4_9FUNG|nr:hypothetical protein K457DRAFT_632775 [Linnemannia elongata AG-77]